MPKAVADAIVAGTKAHTHNVHVICGGELKFIRQRARREISGGGGDDAAPTQIDACAATFLIQETIYGFSTAKITP